MPSMNIKSMYIGFTELENMIAGSASLHWTPGTTRLKIERKGFPEFHIRVDCEVTQISV